MKLIIPMAGRGTRLRPHTHVTPKPLLPVVGLPMVERIIRTFVEVLPRKLEKGVFILGADFPDAVRVQLTQICQRYDMMADFEVQDIADGTAHAVYCAAEHLDGELVVVFADTLFYMSPDIALEDSDVVAWVKHVEDPRRFGVVVKDGDRITDFVEKPTEPISNEALIGIYYIRDGAVLREAIRYQLDHQLRGAGNEYQLTDALDRMLKQGGVFRTATVNEWLDCGTLETFRETSWTLLNKEDTHLQHGVVENSTLIQPVYIGEGARVKHSIVGPNVVIEDGAIVDQSILDHTIVFEHGRVEHMILSDSLIGQHARVKGRPAQLNIGDHAQSD